MVKKSPAKKKGKNSKAEPRKDVTPCTSSQEDPTLLLGELVEVRHREIGYRGSWHPAKVVKIDSDRGLVEYEKLRSRDGEVKHQEYVPFSEDGSKVRPRPPPLKAGEAWQKGLWVDAYYGDAWWEGVLMDEVSDQMQVYFPDEGDRMSFCMSNLRVSQEWDNRSRTWKIKGKMTELSSIEGRKFRLKRTFAVQPKRTTASQATEKASEDSSKRKRGEQVLQALEANSDDESLYSWMVRHKKKQKRDVVQTVPGKALPSREPVNSVQSQSHQNNTSGRGSVQLLESSENVDQTHGAAASTSMDIATEPSALVSKVVQQTSVLCPASPQKLAASPEGADVEMADGTVEEQMDVILAEVAEEQAKVVPESIPSEVADEPAEEQMDVVPSDIADPPSEVADSPPEVVPSEVADSPPEVLPSELAGEKQTELSLFNVVEETVRLQNEPVTARACTNKEVLPTDSVIKKVKLFKKWVDRNSFCKESPSKSAAFSRARSTTKKMLSGSGWKVCQSIRERFNRNSPEPYYVSPEGKPYVTLAAACRELMRRNKHNRPVIDRKKLAHLQLTAKGDDYGYPSDLLAHSCPETSQRTRPDDKTRKQRVEKKRGRPRSGCRLEAATPARKKKEDEEELRIIKRMALFPWLMEMGAVSEHDKIQYLNRETNTLFTGVATQDGILCSCCKVTYSLADFQGHAGSSVGSIASQLRFQNGRTLLDCQLAALTTMKSKEEEAVAAAEDIELDVNDDTCGMCGDGGDLICCDHCPSTFHLKCIQLKNVPEGDWFCPRCCCATCNCSLYNPEHQTDILYCDQCEREYHAHCVNGEGMKYKAGDSHFCSRKCLKIFRRLRKLVGRTGSLDEGYTWTLLRSDLHTHLAEHDLNIEAIAENCSRLALALTVIQECFRPMIDPRTKTDIVTHILYNRRGDDKRLDFRGFYTLVLERGDELVSVASIRIHGAHAAELPFVATRSQFRRKGMCRRLINVVEQVLQALEVQTLVLPAIPEFIDAWTTAFGFQKLSPAQGVQLMELNIVTFPGTSVLHKPLTWLQCGKRPPPLEERMRISLWESDESDDEKIQLQNTHRSESRAAKGKALSAPEAEKKTQKQRPRKKDADRVLELRCQPAQEAAAMEEEQNQALLERQVVVAKARSSRLVKSFADRLEETSTENTIAVVEQRVPTTVVCEDETDLWRETSLKSPSRTFVRRRLEGSVGQVNPPTEDVSRTVRKEKQKKYKKSASKGEMIRHKSAEGRDRKADAPAGVEVAECRKRLSSRITTAEFGAFLVSNWPKSKRSVTVKRPRMVTKQPVLPRRSPRTPR